MEGEGLGPGHSPEFRLPLSHAIQLPRASLSPSVKWAHQPVSAPSPAEDMLNHGWFPQPTLRTPSLLSFWGWTDVRAWTVTCRRPGLGVASWAHAAWGCCSLALRGQRQKGLPGPGEAGGVQGPLMGAGLSSAGALSRLHSVRVELGLRSLGGMGIGVCSAAWPGAELVRGLSDQERPPLSRVWGSWPPRPPCPAPTRWHALPTGQASLLPRPVPPLGVRLGEPQAAQPRVWGASPSGPWSQGFRAGPRWSPRDGPRPPVPPVTL